MPNKDGTGPQGKGPRTGKGLGRKAASQGSESCTCPNCKHLTTHEKSVPCLKQNCPKCDTPMKGENCLE